MSRQETAVCLVSGGMDSALSLALTLEAGFTVAALHVTYGQRTEARERRAFEELTVHYGIDRKFVVGLDHLRGIGGSALTDPAIAVPAGDLDRTGVPVTYVPFRNGNLLSIAAAWCEVLTARTIVIGAVEEDGSGYPDCRRAFFDAFESAIGLGSRLAPFRIATPVIAMSKADIVRRGTELRVPFGKTWSCYRESAVACGACDSCLLRLRGFARAGVRDPLAYAEVSGRAAT